jgi:uroporphyrinogen-III synthase
VYETCQPKHADPVLLAKIEAGDYDLLLFTSPSTFHHFRSMVEPSLLGRLKIASIGSTTTKFIHEAGVEPLLTAKMSNADGLKDAIVNYYKQI